MRLVEKCADRACPGEVLVETRFAIATNDGHREVDGRCNERLRVNTYSVSTGQLRLSA
jgi:hypothetical protein